MLVYFLIFKHHFMKNKKLNITEVKKSVVQTLDSNQQKQVKGGEKTEGSHSDPEID